MYSLRKSDDDPDYVLIHKKALLVNTFVIARLCKLLSAYTDISADEIAEEIADHARDKVHKLSQEEINANVQNLVSNVETERGITIVERP